MLARHILHIQSYWHMGPSQADPNKEAQRQQDLHRVVLSYAQKDIHSVVMQDFCRLSNCAEQPDCILNTE